MNRESTISDLAGIGLKRVLPDLEPMLLESIRFACSPGSGPITIGVSRLGGQPDIPGGFIWPTWRGAPMSFVAQIRLEEVAPFAPAALLPKAGLLSFFYDARQETYGADPNDRGGWQVIHLEGGPESWTPAPYPAGLPTEAQFSACGLATSSEITLPFSPAQAKPMLDWSQDEMQRYDDFLFTRRTQQGPGPFHHRMFGHPEQMQDDMQLQCALYAHGLTDPENPAAKAYIDSKADWQLLLQVDSDANAGMQWASSGMLYFWIETSFLQLGQWDKAWLVLQSE